MGNSTTRLQDIVDYAKTFADLTPVLASGGFSQQPALTIANDVMVAMLARPFAWKWNRIKLPVFYTNSNQQDYASTINNLAWLEYGVVIDINSTAIPKYKGTLETDRDLPETSSQYGQPGQVCWLPNDQLVYGVWGGGTTGEGSTANPGAGSIYGPLNGVGVTAQPTNPYLQIIDPNGNLWYLSNALTTSVTLGLTQPTWPATASIQYPTMNAPSTAATTVPDGTGIWTAINPKGQGLRLNPVPPQNGVVWQVRLFGQMRAPQFTALSQLIDPIPDDFAPYFRRGFIAYAYMHSKDQKVAGKFAAQQALWKESLMTAVQSVDRERDNSGLFPSEAIMVGPGSRYLGPADPYNVGGY